MCGLVGVVGNITKKEINFFRQALAVDVVRGWDSTGVAAISNEEKLLHKEPDYTLWERKDIVTGSEAVQDKSFSSIFDDTANLAIMGHNRAATVGKVTSNNAHPFTHGGITLMHNGTLIDTYNLEGQFDTDSEQIAYTLSRAENTVDVLEKIDGAFALTWLDSRKNTFNLARNDERTLFMMYSRNRETLYYASEEKMLDWILSRNGIPVTEILPLPVGEWLSFSLTSASLTVEKTEFKPIEPYPLYPLFTGQSIVDYNDPIDFIVSDIIDSGFQPNACNLVGEVKIGNITLTARAYNVFKDLVPDLKVGDTVRGLSCNAVYPGHSSTSIHIRSQSIKPVIEETPLSAERCECCWTYVPDRVEVSDLLVCTECVSELFSIRGDDACCS